MGNIQGDEGHFQAVDGELEEEQDEQPRSLGSNDPSIPHPASTKRPMWCSSWGNLTSPSGYRISDMMVNEPPTKPFHVIVIGAGAAGIDFLHHAIPVLPSLNITFTVYDKNADVGGTWFENRYPGCACDVPSASYQFAWRRSPEWSSYYSSAEEIWRYFKGIVEEEGMERWICLRTEIKEAKWEKEIGKWVLQMKRTGVEGKVEGEYEVECDMLLNGTGFLNAWKWPDIEGLNDFKGKKFHTARYEPGYNLKGKRVAVIGSGSSGVQTVASIYKDVDKLYTWVRTPTWVTAGFGQKFAGPDGKNFKYTEAQKAEWRQNPTSMRKYSKLIEQELNQRFKFVLRNSSESDEANTFAYNEMKRKLSNNTRLMSTMVPQNFNVGCRRPTPGNGYLEALVGAKTTCYTSGIKTITRNGFLDSNGKEVEVDVIICATGFDTSFRPRFPITGLDGIPIHEKWKDFPMSYASIGVPGIPNYFMYSGPFTPVAQGSLLPLLTLLSKHFLQIIRKMRLQHIRSLYPKLKPTQDFAEHAQLFLKRTAWSDPCTSWFKGGKKDGNVVMWPGSRLAYFEVMKNPRWEDYEIEYEEGNSWAWLGNGFTVGEFDGSDTTFYLDEEYLEDHLPKGKKWVQPGKEIDGKLGLRVEGESGGEGERLGGVNEWLLLSLM